MALPNIDPIDRFAARMTDGAELQVRRYGNGTGPRLVISHGNGFAVDGYRVFWQPLCDDYDVVVFDIRNHGLNEPTGADGHNYLQQAIDIGTVRDAVTERYGPAKTVGVFHSMSARAAMKQAVERGWIWDALILFDPPNVPPRGHRLYDAMRSFELRLVDYAANRPDEFVTPGDLAKLFRESRACARWDPQAIDDMARAVLRPKPDGTGYTLSCQRELEASIYLAALTLNLWPAAKAFGGPVKLIGADPDLPQNTPTAKANQALAEEGGYRYEAIPETGHLLQIERPEASRAAMLSFLDELGIR
jgi:pimeloyl-ACP methyl ester carboxylesterase